MGKKIWQHYLAYILNRPGIRNVCSPKWYLQMRYYERFGKYIDFKNPTTFNEKLQWLKVYQRKSIQSIMVDKYEVRKYIKDKIGEEYLIPLVGGPWKSEQDIELNELPEKFVLKCTHDSGSVVICKNKSEFDWEKAKRKLRKGLDYNMYWYGREWPYKNVRPQIIAEKYMEDSNTYKTEGIFDYKLFCFNGECKIFKIDFDRFTRHGANYYDSKTKELLEFGEEVCLPDFSRKLVIPKQIDEMIELAEKLSKDFLFLRVDFYVVGEKIYFGELTFFPGSGFVKFIPGEWDNRLGQWCKLKNE